MTSEASRGSERGEAAGPDARTLARGSIISLLGVVGGTLLQFVAFLVVTRGLPTTTAGVFFESVALFMILSGCVLLGADSALVRFVARFRAIDQHQDVGATLVAGLVPVAVFGVVGAAATFAAAPVLAHAFFDVGHRHDAIQCIRTLSVFAPAASVTTVALAGLRGFGSMREYVGIQNLGVPLLRLIGIGAAVISGASLVAVAAGWAFPLAIGCVVSVVLLSRIHGRSTLPGACGSRPLRTVAGDVWGFAAPRAVAGIMGIMVTWLDVLLVGALASTREAAIYAAVSRLLVLGTYTLQAIGLAVASQFSELIATERFGRVERLYQLSTWWMMALSWPLYTLCIVLAPNVMSLFGPSYTDGQTALVILSFAGLFNLCTGNVTLLLLMTGKSVLNLANSAVVLILNVGLDLILIPRFGIEGAAVGWAVSILVNNAAALVEMRRIIPLRPFGDGFWIIAAACIGCFGGVGSVAHLVGGSRPVIVVWAVAVASPLYLWVLWVSRERLGLAAAYAAWRGS